MCECSISGKGRIEVTTPTYDVRVTSVMREGDPYDGAYEVTPNADEHVLHTMGKTLPGNITVHAAPPGGVEVGALERTDDAEHVLISGDVEVDEGWVSQSHEARTYTFDKRFVDVTPIERPQSVIPNGSHEYLSTVHIGRIPERYHDSSGCDVSDNDVLVGRTYVGELGESTGTMPDNDDTGGTIGSVSGTHVVPRGYTTGGIVSLGNVSECVPQNIRVGVSILGVGGTMVVPSVEQDAVTRVLSIS